MSDAAMACSPNRSLTLTGKIAVLFGLWGVLHLWVGFEGLHQYFASPADGQWKMFLGGRNAPVSAFVLPTDPMTIHAQSNIVLNFCLDVAGYGLLGIVVAWLLVRRASVVAYLVGMCDVSFTLLQVTAGIIVPNISSVSGPVRWLLASIITPFGLPRPIRLGAARGI